MLASRAATSSFSNAFSDASENLVRQVYNCRRKLCEYSLVLFTELAYQLCLLSFACFTFYKKAKYISEYKVGMGRSREHQVVIFKISILDGLDRTYMKHRSRNRFLRMFLWCYWHCCQQNGSRLCTKSYYNNGSTTSWHIQIGADNSWTMCKGLG